jgi:2-haloacid dehalogenase
MSQTKAIKALAFDAYGTIFDVYSVIARCEQLFLGRGKELSQLWRTKQLEYTWLRSLLGAYVDFEQVTRDALMFACEALALKLDAASAQVLMDEYRQLKPYPEVSGALEALKGVPMVILSNGSPAMLNALVDNAGLRKHFGQVISVDEVKIFKPSPSVYRLCPDKLGVPAGEIGFVSSNCWDVAGAARFGFKVFWINRFKQPADRLDFQPFKVIDNLAQIVAALKAG